jgi:ribosomal protein S18 acetylase RimI-like enzyme
MLYKILTPADIDTNQQFTDDLNHLAGFTAPGNVPPTRSAADWKQRIQRDGVSLVACVADNLIVGIGTVIVLLPPSRDKALIEDVSVREDYRRRRIAMTIADQLEAIAKQHDVLGINLTSSRPPAQRMWEQRGYEIVATGKTIYYWKPLR